MRVSTTGTRAQAGHSVTPTRPWPCSTATSSFATTWLAARSIGWRTSGHRPGTCFSSCDRPARAALAERCRGTARSSVTSVVAGFRRAFARRRCQQMAAVRIDVEARVDVRAADRAVVDPCHDGAAREGSGCGIPQGLLGQLSVLVAMNNRRADVASSLPSPLQRGVPRNADQTLLPPQADLRCVDRSGVPDVTDVVLRRLSRAIVDTVPRGVRPHDEPVLEAVDEEAIALPVTQREDEASDHAATVRISSATRTAEPRIATVGHETTKSTRVVQRRVLDERSGCSPAIDARPDHVRGDEVADLVPLGVVVL